MQRTMKETYEDEIQSLQEEIQNLNQQFKENQEEAAFLSHDIAKTLESYRRRAIFHVGSTEANVKDLQLIGPFEKDLQFLTAISGIEFTKYLKKTECRKYKTLQSSMQRTKTLFKHRLMGQCQSLAFQLEFQTMESQGKCSAGYDVTDLNIIMEYGEYADLSKFVCRTEERKNLLLFFRTLSKFAEWCEYRKFIFAQFKVRLPFLSTSFNVFSSST
ncbi:centromere protein P-like [Bombina bombina]|uniref:centromere protein P-like n=1 Tax=Bombina bombina TaxID=8345 RepID=UPI00235A8DFE|nr:centromere protein P-like [Bombina bombina]